MMIEYPDVDQRRTALARLIGVEDRVWLQVAGQPRVYAIADEDLDRETDEKTSSVHFLRFELTREMKIALKGGAVLAAGVDHPAYSVHLERVPEALRRSLLEDLD
jgi:hypothetical protein